jgi:hypothetical protein
MQKMQSAGLKKKSAVQPKKPPAAKRKQPKQPDAQPKRPPVLLHRSRRLLRPKQLRSRRRLRARRRRPCAVPRLRRLHLHVRLQLGLLPQSVAAVRKVRRKSADLLVGLLPVAGSFVRNRQSR